MLSENPVVELHSADFKLSKGFYIAVPVVEIGAGSDTRNN